MSNYVVGNHMATGVTSEFAIHAQTILQQPPLQAFVLHLWNAQKYPFDIGSQLRAMDARNYNFMLTLLSAFRRNGPDDRSFQDLAQKLAESR